MSVDARLLLEQDGVERELPLGSRPLTIGGSGADLVLPALPEGTVAGTIALAGDRPYLQANPAGPTLLHNGHRPETSQWLAAGDRLQVGDSELLVELDAAGLRLRADGRAPPPELAAQPPAAVTYGARPAQRRVAGPVVAVLLVLCAIAAWFVFTARSVEIEVVPEPDRISLGGWPALPLGDRYLARPGSYRLRIERAGYYPIEERIEIGEAASQRFERRLVRLPGLLDVDSAPVEGAVVLVDGGERGTTPLRGLELAAGTHAIELRAPRHLPAAQDIEIEGLGHRQRMALELVPAWSAVGFSAVPEDAEIWVDDAPRGRLPLILELDAGERRVEIRAPAFKTWSETLSIAPDRPFEHPLVELEPADARLRLDSSPSGALVTINDRYRGRTPLELALSPGSDYRLELTKRGYRQRNSRLRLAPDETRRLRLELEPELGAVRLRVDPPGAELTVEGRSLGRADGLHRLVALPQLLEIRAAGYQPAQLWVTPLEGLEQEFDISLERVGATPRVIDERITAPDGGTYVLLRPSSFTMGASRREPGRRANETLREVAMQRPYYLASKEVTNAQFRAFRPGHRSGRYRGVDLDGDDLPVVNVSWDDAAGYCNWLNTQAGLPPYDAADPPPGPAPISFRLPTEAEWAWAARESGGETPGPMPWGSAMPPPEGAGNFADRSIGGVLAGVIGQYDDGQAGTAAPGSYAPLGSGLHDLSGNVAEWVQDYYHIPPAQAGAGAADPTGPREGEHRVIRGSSWMQASISQLRWSFRDYGNERRPDVGFRCARYATAAPQ